VDIVYGLLISIGFIVASVWLALKLWDLFERDLRARMSREPEQNERLRYGARDYADRWGDGGGFGGGDGGGG
jgi:hypothetical protein